MAERTTPVLLVTANVGSIFEDPSVMLKIWTEEFLNTVLRLDPKFVALHCQEVGGKNYEESMKHVEYFVKLLMNSEELRLFDKVRVYLDEDYSSAENFTALGNFYFIHESVKDVLIWDFNESCFAAVEGKEVFAGNIEEVGTKEKSKFPQDFFPECKWSRKGFLRTRWNLENTVFDLVNIHLFHDASNFVAMETFPSVYSKTRQRALEYTLDRFHNDAFGPAPFFLFGDFNFRTDTQGVIKKLCDGLKEVRVNNGKTCKVEYQDRESQTVLTLGKKEFAHNLDNSLFIQDLWLREYDKEMECFGGRLFEFPINFQPSYPFSEDRRVSKEYMPTRVPAWCDRVLLSHTAKPLLEEDGNVEYGLIGSDSCMGDHKPVALKCRVVSGAGRLYCCESSPLEERRPLPAPLTERFLVKRVASASVVEVKVGVVKGSAGCWRSRSVSVSNPSWRSASKVRLISKEDLKKSLPRLQSHHSSSEEEWFEEVGPPTPPPSPPPPPPPPPRPPPPRTSPPPVRQKRHTCCAMS